MTLRHGIKAEIKSWPRNIQLFFLANILYQMGGGMFSVLYNLYIQGLGFDPSMNGRVISIQSIATALLFIPIGFMGDKMSRKPILIIGALFSGMTFMGRSFVEEESGLLFLAASSGLFASFFQVLAIPFLAANVTKENRLRLFSIHASLVLAAQVIGSLGGGVFADVLQSAGINNIASLQYVLFFGGIATFLGTFPLFFVKESSIHNKQPALLPKKLNNSSASNKQKNNARASHSDWKFISLFVVTQLLIGTGSGLVVPYLNLYFTDRFDVSLSLMSILISLGQIMTIVSMMIGPSLASRVGPVRAVVIFQVLSLPFLLLTGFTYSLMIASVSFLFRQALMNAANPISSSILIDHVSEKRRGIANSLMQTAFMIGWATMGPVQSYLVTTFGSYKGYAITFTITGLLYVTASAWFYLMFRDKPNHASHDINLGPSPVKEKA
ncbi:MFS transporter [Paenibacillus sp. Marseille-Q4541]|uniref:MFS transporter n=1 Tax=Paenibacillus sp. Marseille-Q4541 TaxID=2831522 RepID=UPI001BAB58EA|nr:MFS transporter [Paenibacillus sp. Marseille-Q4541]